MVTLVNRAKVNTSTVGTGIITLGSAVSGYQTFAAAGVADGQIVRYVIEDGAAWEIGIGTYSATGTTLTRGSIESSNADNLINLTGNAVVYVSAAAADLQELVDFADNFVLPPADGSAGQVLTTNGAGTLSFTTISGYTNADVDTHLNTGTAASGEVLSWNGTDYDWVASGGGSSLTGQTDSVSPFETSLGFNAGLNNTGIQNTFIGFEAGSSNTTGVGNTIVGYQSADSITTGSYNAVLGYSALGANSTGSRTVAIGVFAAGAALSGADNTLVGHLAYSSATSGSYNVAIGRNAIGLTTGTINGNVAVGYRALEDVTSDYNVAIGYSAGANITSGLENVAIGYQSLDSNTTGIRNVGIGSNSLGLLTTGANNVAIGTNTLAAATTGGLNIAIGQDAMGLGVATSASGHNVAVGYLTGYNVTTATDNVFLGKRAGTNITTGSTNTAIGVNALSSGISSFNSVAIGANSLANSTGFTNTAIGILSGASLTSGTNNTLLGYYAEASSPTVSNEITLGNSSISALRCSVTTITSLSDGRDKVDVQPLKAGLNFVEALSPVSFTWNTRDGGKVGIADTGFIAQDLQKVQADLGVNIPELVYEANPDKLEAGYGKLIPVLVQAIKDLSAKVTQLETQLGAR